MTHKCFTLIVLVVLLVGYPEAAQAQLVLYDDFGSGFIDPDRWTGSEGSFGPLAPNTGAERRISSARKLLMDTTTWGRTDVNTGGIGAQGSRLNVIDPTPITTLQADVTVRSAAVVGCDANPTRTFALAQVQGAFFNDGTSPGPGDRTGDIIVSIQKTLDNISGNRIEAIIFRCGNATCTVEELLTFQFFSTQWRAGRADTLRLQWDQLNHQFIFTVNPDGRQAETITLNYAVSVSDSNSPVRAFRQLSIGNKPASCTTPAPRTMADMRALFDNVMVNP